MRELFLIQATRGDSIFLVLSLWSSLVDLEGAVQQIVDQRGNILDVDVAAIVNIGIVKIDALGSSVQQIVDEYRHVLDVDVAVTVHVARIGEGSLGEDDGVERGGLHLDLFASTVVVGIDKVFPAVYDVVKVNLYRLGLASCQNDWHVYTLNRGAGVARRVLVELEGKLLVVGLGAVVGDSELYAELVAGDNLVGGIGDVQHRQCAAQ